MASLRSSAPTGGAAARFHTLLRCFDVIHAASSSDGDCHVTPFHSSTEPPVQLSQYVHRVAYYSGYGCEGLEFGLVLMARMAKATGKPPSRLMLHRLALACVQVGMKTNCDFFVKNTYAAQIGGVALSEMNALELHLLSSLEFRAMATSAELQDATSALLELAHQVDSGLSPGSHALYVALSNSAKNDFVAEHSRGVAESPAPPVERLAKVFRDADLPDSEPSSPASHCAAVTDCSCDTAGGDYDVSSSGELAGARLMNTAANESFY